MARYRQKTSRGLKPTALLLSTGLFVLVGGGVAGILYQQGFFDEISNPEPDRTGQLPAVVVAREVPAFTKIRPEHLRLPDGDLSLMWLPQETIEAKKASGEWLVSLSDVVGRVLKRDKRPGLIFTPNDFYPEGTREGIAAGVPPGKKAITVETSKIRGLDLLRQGDSFDLFVSLPRSQREVSRPTAEYGLLVGGIKPPDLRVSQISRQSGVKLVVEQGEMITLTKGRQQTTQGVQTLTPDANSNNRRQSTTQTLATIAVDPLEVLPLMEALSLDRLDGAKARDPEDSRIDLFCVVRSGRGDDVAEEAELEQSIEGMIPIPAPYRPVSIYSPITMEDLIDPLTGKLNVYYFPPERVDERWLDNAAELVGRVARHEIAPGFLISEESLLPVGTIAGVTAGVPEGMVAAAIPLDKINGLNRLRTGDRFEILSSLPSKPTTLPPTLEWVDLQGGTLDQERRAVIDQLRSGISVVVHEAEFVKLLDGDDEVAIALTPESVTPLMEALNANVSLSIVLKQRNQSGQDPNSVAPPTVARSVKAAVNNSNQDSHIIEISQNSRDADNLIQVPVIARPIAAYSKITLEDFKGPVTGKLRTYQFPASRVGENWMLDVNDLIGRVAKEDLKTGYVVFAEQLFPAGTRPGPTAGIPPGKRSMLLTTDDVAGLTAFKQGDLIELVAARPYNVGQLGQTQTGLESGDPTGEAAAGPFDQADVAVIATEVLIVTRGDPEVRSFTLSQPVNEVQETTFGGAVLSRSSTTTRQIQTIERTVTDFTLALSAKEVTLVSEALATNANIYAVARSGNADARAPLEPVEANESLKGAKIVETIRNGNKSRQVWIDGNPKYSQSNTAAD